MNYVKIATSGPHGQMLGENIIWSKVPIFHGNFKGNWDNHIAKT